MLSIFFHKKIEYSSLFLTFECWLLEEIMIWSIFVEHFSIQIKFNGRNLHFCWQVNVQRVNAGGKVMKAANFGRQPGEGDSAAAVELSEDEKTKQETIRQVWKSILSTDVDDATDFFAAGAGSMDVVRLVEELKDKVGVSLQNEDVFMATKFSEFIQCVVSKLRGGSGSSGQVEYDPVVLNVNNMEVRFPHQMFVNGKFMDAQNGKTTAIINPTDESVICHVRLKKYHLFVKS